MTRMKTMFEEKALILPIENRVHLNCRYTTWNNLDVVEYKLEELWTLFPPMEQVEGEDFFEPLKKDIKTNGLNNPIVVVPITKALTERWEGRMAKWLRDNPINWNEDEVQLTVFTGNNRYEAAKQLGYSSIDCVVMKTDDLVGTSRLQYPGSWRKNND